MSFHQKFWKTIIAYYIGYLPAGFLYSITSVTLGLLMDFSGIEKHQGGYLVAMRSFGLALSSLFTWFIFDWYSFRENKRMRKLSFDLSYFQISHHRILVFSLLMCSIIEFSIPFFSNYHLLLVVHFFLGVFAGIIEIGFIVVVTNTWINTNFDKWKGEELSEYFLFGLDSVIGVGSILFPFVMYIVYSVTNKGDHQLRIPYFLCSVFTILCSIGMMVTKSPRKEEDDEGYEEINFEKYEDDEFDSDVKNNNNNNKKEEEEEEEEEKNYDFVKFMVHLLAGIIGLIMVGTINSYIALLFSFCKTNSIDTDSNLSLMMTIFCVIYMFSRLSYSCITIYIKVWILVTIDIFMIILVFIVFLMYPRSRIVAWGTTFLFSVFAAPVSTSLLILSQSTYSYPLTENTISWLFGAQFLGEFTQAFLISFLSDEKYLGNMGILIVCLVSTIISFFLLIILFGIGLNKKSS